MQNFVVILWKHKQYFPSCILCIEYFSECGPCYEVFTLFFFTSIANIYYVHVHDRCFVVQLSFYFTNINVIRAVLPFQFRRKINTMCLWLDMRCEQRLHYTSHHKVPALKTTSYLPCKMGIYSLFEMKHYLKLLN